MQYTAVNGRIVPAQEAVVSVADRGFRYGDGAFETIALVRGVPYRYDWHMARLAAGLAAIGIAFDVKALEATCRALMARNRAADGLLRIQVTRGAGGRGYLPQAADPTCVIETLPAATPPEGPVSLFLSGYLKIPAAALPVQHKLCQGLNPTLARMEAAAQGCAEALQINIDGQLCEASSANLFWVQGGALFTPALACGALAGATRAALMELSPLPVHEVEEPVEALHDAGEVFLTNTAWGVLPVAELRPVGWRWENSAQAEALQALLTKDRERDAAEHRARWAAGE